jgi:hypothetical protein
MALLVFLEILDPLVLSAQKENQVMRELLVILEKLDQLVELVLKGKKVLMATLEKPEQLGQLGPVENQAPPAAMVQVDPMVDPAALDPALRSLTSLDLSGTTNLKVISRPARHFTQVGLLQNIQDSLTKTIIYHLHIQATSE